MWLIGGKPKKFSSDSKFCENCKNDDNCSEYISSNLLVFHYGQIMLQVLSHIPTFNCIQALGELTKVFNGLVKGTYTSSAVFIKQLAVIAVSSITYLRSLFPEDNYMEDVFGGMPIKILKNKCTDHTAQFLITAMNNAFEAFDKKYVSLFVNLDVIHFHHSFIIIPS